MNYIISIPCDLILYTFPLLRKCDYQRIYVPDVVIFDIYKIHNHRYDMKAFFYDERIIVSSNSYSTKKELFGAIQKLLQQYL